MMRIATSTIYSNQTLSIENLEAQYQQQGQELSTGIALNEPSDNPTIIAQDLSVRNDSSVTTQIGQNLTGLNNLLSTTDSTLSSLTTLLQSARNLAIEGASDTVTPAQRGSIGQQVNQLLQQAIGLANTQYDGKYVFSGTAASAGSTLVSRSGESTVGRHREVEHRSAERAVAQRATSADQRYPAASFQRERGQRLAQRF